MRSYNQFCPVAKAAELFCERWTALIIRDLAGGPLRFSQLQRGVPLASPTLLSKRLKELEAEGVVTRQRADGAKTWLYALTEAGQEFVPIVVELGIWGQRWTRRELEEREVDLGLLLWALEKGARPSQFGRKRTIVEFELRDQPEHKRRWWYLNEDGQCELCLTAPDKDADIFAAITLPDLVRVWRGDITLPSAIDDGLLELHASPKLCAAFGKWLGIASIAHVESQRDRVTTGS